MIARILEVVTDPVEHWGTLAGIGAALVVIVAAVVRGVVRPVLRYAHRVEASLTWVEAQMKPNGGSSLRDAVDKVLRMADALETRLEAQDRTAGLLADVKEEIQ